MKSKRTLLFRLLTVAVLAGIAAVMLVIGRGHTIYFDNVALDYQGQTYEPPYKVVIYNADGAEITKLYDRERGMTTCVGQKLDLTLEIAQEKGGEEELVSVTLSLPYGLDGIIINLPGYLEGLPEDAYLTEFVPVITDTDEDEEVVLPGDDMMMGDI